jgi:hypothetical protein
LGALLGDGEFGGEEGAGGDDGDADAGHDGLGE